MEFGHIEIFVKEPMKSKDFYIDILGFEAEEIQHEKFVWLKKDSKIVLLRPGINEIKADAYQKTAIAFVFYTDDLMKTVKEFKEKGVEFKGTDGSEKCLTFTDNDGNWFQLVNPNEH